MPQPTFSNLTPEDQHKQALYRDARSTEKYNDIWQTVGKCVFCDLKDKYIFFEEHGIVMTVSLYAYIDGNFMIIPRHHIRSVKDLTELEWKTIRKFIYIAKKLIREVHGIKGVQYVLRDGGITAQSTVSDHLHFHAIPFDAPDLCTWNFRQLKYTPLENATLYRKARRSILHYEQKFEQKYRNDDTARVVCDLAIINTRGEILLQEREPGSKFVEDFLSLPGGGVGDYQTGTLEEELVREVREETGLAIDAKAVALVASRLSTIHYRRRSHHLEAEYAHKHRFLWNTYVLRDFDPTAPLTPGDDCEALIWLPLTEAANHPRVSPEIRAFIEEKLA